MLIVIHSVDSNKRGIHAKPQDAPTQLITIGEDVWIGANVTILKGVTIGDRTVVGSISLINKDIEADTLEGEIPASGKITAGVVASSDYSYHNMR